MPLENITFPDRPPSNVRTPLSRDRTKEQHIKKAGTSKTSQVKALAVPTGWMRFPSWLWLDIWSTVIKSANEILPDLPNSDPSALNTVLLVQRVSSVGEAYP